MSSLGLLRNLASLLEMTIGCAEVVSIQCSPGRLLCRTRVMKRIASKPGACVSCGGVHVLTGLLQMKCWSPPFREWKEEAEHGVPRLLFLHWGGRGRKSGSYRD